MAFPPKLLNDHEEIVLDLRPHWFFFFAPMAWAAGVLVLMIFVAAITDGTAQQWLLTASVIGLVGLLAWAGIRYLTWINTQFVITTDRVIYRSGIFAKKGIQIPLERVNNVIFRQNFFERLIGAGDLTIESAAETGQQVFRNVRKPDEVQNVIYREMDLAETRRYDRMGNAARKQADADDAAAAPATPLPPPPPAPDVDVTGQLERLEGLLQRGTITKDEFDAQKAKLLGG